MFKNPPKALVRIPPGDQGVKAGSVVEAMILSLT
jgi:hypothetical protein